MGNLAKPRVIDIAPVENIISISFIKQGVHSFHIVDASGGNMHERGYLGINVKQGREFDASLGPPKFGPPEHAETEINGCRIKSIYLAFDLKIIVCPVFSGDGDKMVSEFFKDFAVAIQICLRKIAEGNVFTENEML